MPSLASFDKWSDFAFQGQFLCEIETRKDILQLGRMNYAPKNLHYLSFLFSNGCRAPLKNTYDTIPADHVRHTRISRTTKISSIKFGLLEDKTLKSRLNQIKFSGKNDEVEI